MSVRVTRDWRGVKYRMSEYSRAELAVLRGNAEQADELIHRFLRQVDEEIHSREATASAHDGR